MVQKKNGNWRLCDDYHQLNPVTFLDQYPLIHIHDIAQRLHNKKFFSTIDLIRAYYHIPIKECDISKTAVTTPFGLFEFTVMPFSLRNVAHSFQYFIHEVQRDFDFCDVYLDDILVYSTSESEHYTQLSIFFEKLKSYGIAINTSKCILGKEEVLFLGHYILKYGIKPNPETVAEIKHFNKRQTVVELRRFLATINFYRRFISKVAQTQLILNDFLRGS